MKFVVSSSSFLMRLQAVSKVISGKPAQPILDNILLVAKDDTLYATASDKETTMEAKIELDNLETPGWDSKEVLWARYLGDFASTTTYEFDYSYNIGYNNTYSR